MGKLANSLARLGGSVAVGDLVADKYRVEGVLGEGGMGVVLAARQVGLDRLVAMKLLPEDAAQDPVQARRFLHEARAAARLKSDHVATVIDVGTLPSGVPYMVMEHLEGADLDEVLASQGPLDVTTACDFVVQACQAIGEAHALGIVHRDLKPANLYLTTRVGGTAMIKVLDFGVSKVLTAKGGALTTTSAAVGSPIYMAPEQMRASRTIDARVDVWALGVVLYELLTRRNPFEADSLAELCVKVVGEPPVPIRHHRPELPHELVAVVDCCLRKDPAMRFADARELSSALEPFVPSVPATISTPSVPRVVVDLADTADALAPPAIAPLARRRTRLLGLVAAMAIVTLPLGLFLARRSLVPPVPSAATSTVSPVAEEPPPAAPESLAPEVPEATTTALAPSPAPSPHPVPATPRLPVRPMPSSAPVDDIPAFR